MGVDHRIDVPNPRGETPGDQRRQGSEETHGEEKRAGEHRTERKASVQVKHQQRLNDETTAQGVQPKECRKLQDQPSRLSQRL